MPQPPFSYIFSSFCRKMTKVIRGDLSGERQKGYESYKTNYGVGPSVTVRRGIPTTEIAAVGTSLAQRQQKNAFYVATSVYSKFNNLEKDFYHRWWVIDKTIDPQYTLEKRILTGRQLAISQISRAIVTQGEPYLKPLPFCICAVDSWGNPAPGHELNIECEKLGNYTYKEENNIYGCFQPSSLSAKYEPYHLFYTDAADYCLLTAEEIHKIKTLPVIKSKLIWKSYEYYYWIILQSRKRFTPGFHNIGLMEDSYEMRATMTYPGFTMNPPGIVRLFSGPTEYETFNIGNCYDCKHEWFFTGHEGEQIQFIMNAPYWSHINMYNVNWTLEVLNLPC